MVNRRPSSNDLMESSGVLKSAARCSCDDIASRLGRLDYNEARLLERRSGRGAHGLEFAVIPRPGAPYERKPSRKARTQASVREVALIFLRIIPMCLLTVVELIPNRARCVT